MIIPVYRCQLCKEEFENVNYVRPIALHQMPQEGAEPEIIAQRGQRWPACPKCNAPFTTNSLTRYLCDLKGCDNKIDQTPGGWIHFNFVANQFHYAVHWEGGRLVRGDITGNQNAGGFKAIATTPMDLYFCCYAHMVAGVTQQLETELAQTFMQWRKMEGQE